MNQSTHAAASGMDTPLSHILIRNPAVRWTFLATLGVMLAIFYWLLALRQSALDITFERIFNGLFMFYDYPMVVVALVIMPAALLPQMRSFALQFLEWCSRHVHVVATCYFVLLALGAVFVYHAHPVSMDEYSVVFQSKVFAALELTARFPVQLLDWLVPQGFQNYFLAVSHEDGRVASSYWPAFSLMLAPFSALGVEWLCNPILGATGILVVHRIAWVIFDDRRAAALAALMTVAAPAFAINAMSLYSMTAHVVLNGIFVLLILQPSRARALAAGVIGSIALCLHNPVPHALFAAPWILSWLVSREHRSLLLPLFAGYLPLSLLLGLGWTVLIRGVSDTAGIEAASSSAMLSMQLSDVFTFPTLGLLYARLVALAKLYTWAVPLSVTLSVLGYIRWRKCLPIRLFAYSAILTFVGYLFVPFDQGHGWGFRYFHSAWVVIPLLAAGAIARGPTDTADDRSSTELAGYASASALISLLVSLPLSGFLVEKFISTHLAQRPQVEGGGVVVLRPAAGYYAYDLVQNDPFLRDAVIILNSRGRAIDAELMRTEFPNLQLVRIEAFGSVWQEKPPEAN